MLHFTLNESQIFVQDFVVADAIMSIFFAMEVTLKLRNAFHHKSTSAASVHTWCNETYPNRLLVMLITLNFVHFMVNF